MAETYDSSAVVEDEKSNSGVYRVLLHSIFPDERDHENGEGKEEKKFYGVCAFFNRKIAAQIISQDICDGKRYSEHEDDFTPQDKNRKSAQIRGKIEYFCRGGRLHKAKAYEYVEGDYQETSGSGAEKAVIKSDQKADGRYFYHKVKS